MKIPILFFLLIITVNCIDQSQLHLADSFVMLDGDTYYAYGTWNDNGIECYSSQDLKTWKYEGLAIKKGDTAEDRLFWAPEVYKLGKEKYIMYLTVNEKMQAATSKSPKGPFKNEKKKLMVDKSIRAIDNHLFIDDDGKVFYGVWNGNGNSIWMADLENDYMTVKKGTEKKLFDPTEDYELKSMKFNEGPFVIKRNEVYILSYSINLWESPDYAIAAAATRDIHGKWYKYPKGENPIFFSSSWFSWNRTSFYIQSKRWFI